MSDATEAVETPIEEILKIVPERIADERGGHYMLSESDRVVLFQIHQWSDEELEQNLYIMTPFDDVESAEQEKRDLLKYLSMDARLYALMFGFASMEMDRRNKDRTSLKRISPLKRRWRVPKL